MVDAKDLFRDGPLEQPLDDSAFNAAIGAVAADRERIIRELISELDKLIIAVQQWAAAAQTLLAIGQSLMPLLENLPKAGEVVTEAKKTCPLSDLPTLAYSLRSKLTGLSAK